MKKLSVIIGATPKVYVEKYNFFKDLEKKFKCKVKKENEFKFLTVIADNEVEFLFAFKPLRDKSYEKTVKESSESISPPAKEVIRSIKSEKVLFLGFCGGLNAIKNAVYLPNTFSKVYFKSHPISISEINQLKKPESIKYSNFLSRKMNAKNARVVTMNLSLKQNYIEDNSKVAFEMLLDKLKSIGDLVETETYEIVSGLKSKMNKTELGIMLFVTDTFDKKENMLNDWKNLQFDVESYKKNA